MIAEPTQLRGAAGATKLFGIAGVFYCNAEHEAHS